MRSRFGLNLDLDVLELVFRLLDHGVVRPDLRRPLRRLPSHIGVLFPQMRNDKIVQRVRDVAVPAPVCMI